MEKILRSRRTSIVMRHFPNENMRLSVFLCETLEETLIDSHVHQWPRINCLVITHVKRYLRPTVVIFSSAHHNSPICREWQIRASKGFGHKLWVNNNQSDSNDNSQPEWVLQIWSP